MEQLQWNCRRRKLGELTPLTAEENPFGKLTQEKRRRLEQKLQRLGTFEAATVDHTDRLLSFNKRHALLTALYGPDYEVEVMHPSRPLTEAERKEVILDSNIHEGDWVQELLDEFADVLDLSGLELAAADAAAATSAEAALQEEKPEYPIVARMSEQYDAIVIVCRNAIDFNHVAQLLGLEMQQSYKSKETGTTHVIDAERFAALWKSR